MFDNLFDERLISLNIKADNWQQAIIKASEPLVAYQYVTDEYVQDMIDAVKQYGPYIVLVKHIALPHGKSNKGALKNGIGLATLKKPVEFGKKEYDPIKFIIPLSAVDNTAHLQALTKLSALLENQDFFTFLAQAKTSKEVLEYLGNIS